MNPYQILPTFHIASNEKQWGLEATYTCINNYVLVGCYCRLGLFNNKILTSQLKIHISIDRLWLWVIRYININHKSMTRGIWLFLTSFPLRIYCPLWGIRTRWPSRWTPIHSVLFGHQDSFFLCFVLISWIKGCHELHKSCKLRLSSQHIIQKVEL